MCSAKPSMLISPTKLAALLSVILLTVVGCGAGAAQLEALGAQLEVETDALLSKFEAVKDVATAQAALPELLSAYDSLVANAKKLESSAKRNLGRGVTSELQDKLTKQREAFSKRFSTHRKKLSSNLKAMQTLEPLFQKMASDPMK